MLKKKRFLFGGIVIFMAVGYLGFVGFQSSATYYYTVSELKAQGNSIYEKNVRVNGEVMPGSIVQDTGTLKLEFILAEGEDNLSVIYHGVVPDAFEAGKEVVVAGYLNLDGILQADEILTKCPSKYVPDD